MVSTATSPAPVQSTVPGTRVLHAINPLVSAILRSPFHGMLSGSLLLLSFTGRSTGKTYTVPVGYTRDGETLLLFTDRAWRTNLRGHGGAPVTVLLQGRRRTGRGELIADPAAVVATVEHLITQYGPKAVGRRVGLTLDAKAPPSHGQLATAMEGHELIALTLD